MGKDRKQRFFYIVCFVDALMRILRETNKFRYSLLHEKIAENKVQACIINEESTKIWITNVHWRIFGGFA